MISEDRVAAILNSADTLDRAADELIAGANEAGGRDNITVVLFRVEEVGGDDADEEQTTMVAVPEAVASSDSSSEPSPRSGSAVALAPAPTQRAPLARSQGRREPPPPRRPPRRFAKPLAALLATAIVVALIGAAGYLATRQLYFIGTDAQGIVTIYRGLPYDLPAGIRLYETFYVSGVPATLVPPDRRAAVFNNNLRSESSATSLVHELELGQLSQ
jgi:protein phosphatase